MEGAGLGIEGVALSMTHFLGRVTSSHLIVLGRETLAFVISVINKVIFPFCGLRRTQDAHVFMPYTESYKSRLLELSHLSYLSHECGC